MELTPTYNAAAGGPSGEAGTVTGSGPHGPSGPDTSSSGESHSESLPSAPAHGEAQFLTSEQFSTAVESSASRVVENHPSETAHPGLTVDFAQRELETLEEGRAKPKPQLNQEPRQPLKKIVDSKIERQREARVSALKAYLNFKEREPEITNSQDEVDDLEPRL
jgi:hypothetical protein